MGKAIKRKGEVALKFGVRLLLGAGCVLLLAVSWIIAVNSKSAADKQLDLMRQAAELVGDGVYIRAIPLLEEAAALGAANTLAAEEELKKAYLALIDSRGVSRKYTGLLEKQMNRKDALPAVFAEAANYYLSVSRVSDALTVLTAGIAKTGCGELMELYEKSRYAYETSRTSYDFVAAINGSTVQVQLDGLWGIANADGTLLIPCEYEKISTFDADRAVVMNGGIIYAVDRNNFRVALLRDSASDFGNLSENRIPVMIGGSWLRATGEFVLGTVLFDEIGMYSEGYAAAKTEGRWGVIDIAAGWLIPAEYDGIIQDELGRCHAQGAVFAQRGSSVFLFVGGQRIGDVYDDARPFSDDGFAAVKRNGKWGFIDTRGRVMIGFRFEDALSFGQHLAAVKKDGHWGYISRNGQIVIDTAFLEAKSFSNGSAPVLTQYGWQFITLIEFRKGASL